MMAIAGGAAAEASAPPLESQAPAQPQQERQQAVVDEGELESKKKRAVARRHQIPVVLHGPQQAPTTSWSSTGVLWSGFKASRSSTRPARKVNRLHLARAAKQRRRRAQ